MKQGEVAQPAPEWIYRVGLGRVVDAGMWGLGEKQSVPSLPWGGNSVPVYFRMAADGCLAECEKMGSSAPPE